MNLSNDQLRTRLIPFQADLSPEQLVQVRQFLALLELWNRKISLVSASDISQLVERHVGESIFGVSAVPIRHGRLADVGTGAGFPGIPLKIAQPGLELTLIESNQRKSAFLSEAIRTLQLTSCNVITSRYEDIDSEVKFDFITSRALGNYEGLLNWAATRLSDRGKIVFWLGTEDAIRLSKISKWRWFDQISIPNSNLRVLLIGSPESHSGSIQ